MHRGQGLAGGSAEQQPDAGMHATQEHTHFNRSFAGANMHRGRGGFQTVNSNMFAVPSCRCIAVSAPSAACKASCLMAVCLQCAVLLLGL
jgi:hypothetical protein